MKSLAAAYPKGVTLSGTCKIKAGLFESEIRVFHSEQTVEQFYTLLQEFATVVAQVAFDFPEDRILDKSGNRIPGKYLLDRPPEVKAVLGKLSEFYNNLSFMITRTWQSEFESVVLEVEQFAWKLGRTAKLIDV